MVKIVGMRTSFGEDVTARGVDFLVFKWVKCGALEILWTLLRVNEGD